MSFLSGQCQGEKHQQQLSALVSGCAQVQLTKMLTIQISYHHQRCPHWPQLQRERHVRSSMRSKCHLTAGDQPCARCEAHIFSSPSIHTQKGEYAFRGKGNWNSVQLRQAGGSSVTARHGWQKQAVWSLYSLPSRAVRSPSTSTHPTPRTEIRAPRKAPLGTY